MIAYRQRKPAALPLPGALASSPARHGEEGCAVGGPNIKPAAIGCTAPLVPPKIKPTAMDAPQVALWSAES